eukprot:jgi/Galph1/820/GphlegSOOS_G5480.1
MQSTQVSQPTEKLQENEDIGRRDGRNSYEIRGFRCEMGYLERADGSCRLEQGTRKSLPLFMARGRNDHAESSSVEVSIRPSQRLSVEFLRLYENILREIFQATVAAWLHPRSTITMILQIVENEGSVESAFINAGMLALLSAGIPCLRITTACTVSFIEGRRFLLDPTRVEERESYSSLLISCAFEGSQSNVRNNVIGLKSSGFVSSEDTYFEALSYSFEACRKVYEFIQLVTEKSLLFEWSSNDEKNSKS